MARVGLGHFPLLCSGSLPTTPIGAGTVVDTQLGRNHLLYHSSVRPRVARSDPFSASLFRVGRGIEPFLPFKIRYLEEFRSVVAVLLDLDLPQVKCVESEWLG